MGTNTYAITSSASNVRIVGSGGPNRSIIQNTSTTADVFYVTGNIWSFGNFAIIPSTNNNTCGAALHLSGSPGMYWIRNMIIDHQYIGVLLDGGANQVSVFISDVIINDSNYRGIQVTNFGGDFFMDEFEIQGAGVNNVSVGIEIQSGDTFLLANGNIGATGYQGILLDPQSGMVLTDVRTANVQIDSSQNAEGLLIDGSSAGVGYLERVYLDNCWVSTHHTYGIHMLYVREVQVVGCTVLTNQLHGIYLDNVVSGIVISGCTICANGQSGTGYAGIYDTNQNGVLIVGNRIGSAYINGSPDNNHQHYGVWLHGSYLNAVQVSDNDVTGNVKPAGILVDGGATAICTNNRGYNPQGFAAPQWAPATSITNTNPYRVRVYIETSATGTTFTVWDPAGNGSPNGFNLQPSVAIEVTLDPGATIKFSSSTGLTLNWYGV